MASIVDDSATNVSHSHSAHEFLNLLLYDCNLSGKWWDTHVGWLNGTSRTNSDGRSK